MADPPAAPAGSLWDLPTPCLLLERDKLNRNIRRMNDRLRAMNAPLRPHVKTSKSADVVRAMEDGHGAGITVSTLAEAEAFAALGHRDILYGVGIAPHRLGRARRLLEAGVELAVLVDSLDSARSVAASGQGEPAELGVFIEIDSGGHRAGLRCDDPIITRIAGIIEASPGCRLRGVLAHAGESYRCRDTAAIAAVAEAERCAAVAAAETLRGRGFECPDVSVGSTPTATFGTSFSGVTEVRAGVYAFQDLTMAGLGVCGIGDIAVSVLATVISSNAATGRVIVDAGWSALSRDRSTATQPVDQFYGLVCDEQGQPSEPFVIRETSQEHGLVATRLGGPVDADEFPIGRRIRILPNHACATAAMHDVFHVLDGGQVAAAWARMRGW